MARIVLAGDITDEFTHRKIKTMLTDVGHDVVDVPSEDCSPPKLLRRRFLVAQKAAIYADVVVVGCSDTTLVAWGAASAAIFANVPVIMVGQRVDFPCRMIPHDLIDYQIDDWRDLGSVIEQVKPPT